MIPDNCERICKSCGSGGLQPDNFDTLEYFSC
jgi:hypothetical protein